MRLEIFGTADAKRWDDIVNSSVNGTLYHTWDWLKIVEKHSSSKLFPLVFFDADDDKPFGAIPLFYMRKFGVKMVFSPPPGSSITLGPLLNGKGYKQHKFELAYLDFQSNMDKFIDKLGSNYTYILTSPNLLDIRPFSWAGYAVTPCYTYKIDLSQGEELVWDNMSKYLKKNIKRAKNKGISITESVDIDGLDYVYSALEKRYAKRRLNFPVQKTYLQDLLRQFGRSAIRISLAIHGGKTVGALLYTTHKDIATAWVGGVRNDLNDLEANELLHWEAIVRATRDGYRWFEIMGANTRHLCEFKARFCPALSIMFQMKKANLLGNLAEKTYMLMQKRPF